MDILNLMILPQVTACTNERHTSRSGALSGNEATETVEALRYSRHEQGEGKVCNDMEETNHVVY
jgi:hypothetical protein